MPTAPTAFLAPCVEPLALLVRDWHVDGKLDEDDLERALTARARAWVDGVCEAQAAIPPEDVETLVALVAEQLGGEAALSDLAGEIATGWLLRAPFEGLLRAARPLPDGPGFVVSQAAEWLAVRPDWSYSGGRDGFEVRLEGLAAASPALKAYFGGLLARLSRASLPRDRSLDWRIEGVDGGALVVSAVVESGPGGGAGEQSRLRRAALVP
ncbi:MAG: hypothetical protein R3F35_19040 [Myxococcota bacterium]